MAQHEIPPPSATTVEFTEDMAWTLMTTFKHYAREGVVTLELRAGGLWLVHPATNSRQFLGATKPLDWGGPGRKLQ